MSTKAMGGYPVVLRLEGRLCLVVGAGAVALRKVQKLLAAGAKVRVIAPNIRPELLAILGIEVSCRPFREGDLDDVFLVFAATNDRSVNAAVAACAAQRGKLVNLADDAEQSDFLLPAILQRGELTVTVSSAGASPAFAAQLRDHLATVLGPEWQIFCALAAALRQKRLTGGEASAYNRAVVSGLFAADLPRLLANQDEEGVNHLLQQLTGVPLTLADLGLPFEKGTT